MKLARKIREQLVRTPTHLDGSGCACITDSAGNIHVPPDVIESIIAAHLEPVLNCLLAYKVHTLRGDHGKAARAVLDALALLDTSVPVTASEGDKRQD